MRILNDRRADLTVLREFSADGKEIARPKLAAAFLHNARMRIQRKYALLAYILRQACSAAGIRRQSAMLSRAYIQCSPRGHNNGALRR